VYSNGRLPDKCLEHRRLVASLHSVDPVTSRQLQALKLGAEDRTVPHPWILIFHQLITDIEP
jgi:hypothetical protein